MSIFERNFKSSFSLNLQSNQNEKIIIEGHPLSTFTINGEIRVKVYKHFEGKKIVEREIKGI